jgi:hypothetical protein
MAHLAHSFCGRFLRVELIGLESRPIARRRCWDRGVFATKPATSWYKLRESNS